MTWWMGIPLFAILTSQITLMNIASSHLLFENKRIQ